MIHFFRLVGTDAYLPQIGRHYVLKHSVFFLKNKTNKKTKNKLVMLFVKDCRLSSSSK